MLFLPSEFPAPSITPKISPLHRLFFSISCDLQGARQNGGSGAYLSACLGRLWREVGSTTSAYLDVDEQSGRLGKTGWREVMVKLDEKSWWCFLGFPTCQVRVVRFYVSLLLRLLLLLLRLLRCRAVSPQVPTAMSSVSRQPRSSALSVPCQT